MQPSAGNAVTPDPLVWALLPPERRAAAVALLAMLAARAAACVAGGGRDEPGEVPAAGAAAAEDPPGAPGPGGEPASANPTLHLRRLDGGQLVGHYIACFERVWDSAKLWSGEEV